MSLKTPMLRQSRVKGEIQPDVDVAYIPSTHKVENIPPSDWSWPRIFFAPFNDENTNPFVLSTILVAAQIFIFTFFTAIVLNLAAEKICTELNLVVAGPATGAALLAFLQLGIIYAFGWFTREKYLPTYIMPEFYLSMVITRKIGLVVAIVGCAIGFFGYSMGGLAAIAFNNHSTSRNIAAATFNPTNVPSSPNSYWLYWLAGTLINLAWLWCTQFRNDKSEEDTSMYQRGLTTIAALTFVFVLAFFGLPAAGGNGLIYFSPGMYASSAIFTHTLNTFSGDGIGPLAGFLVIGLVFVPLTAAGLFVLLGWTASYRPRVMSAYCKIPPKEGAMQGATAGAGGFNPNGSSVNKNIYVNY